MAKSLKKKAIDAILKQGVLLVYPIDNRPQPRSLWHELYPKSKMRWEWDEDGDDRVSSLWFLREQLSTSREVVYTKWYQGRATFFSPDVFKALYRQSREWTPPKWLRESDEILETLRMDSPLSTKQIKEAVGLQGKMLERVYERAMKPLWQHFDIVAFGEVEDSSFPSLAVGASESIFEDWVNEAQGLSLAEAENIVNKYLPPDSLWGKFLKRTKPGSAAQRVL